MIPFEVVSTGADDFSVLDANTGKVVVVDGTQLTGLTLDTAGAYVYALGVLNGVEIAGSNPKLRNAIERTLKPSSVSTGLHLGDIVVSVRWMVPELEISSDVLKPLILKIASESGKVILDL